METGISLAAGVPLLGEFRVSRAATVAIVSGESGAATLQRTALRIIKAKGLDPAAVFDRLRWCFDLPQFLDLAHVIDFVEQLKALNCEVVIIDPFYLCLGGAVDHADLFAMGPALKVVADLLVRAGITPIIVHHASRQLKPGPPMERLHLAYSGLEQFARQWILINRQSAYEGDGGIRFGFPPADRQDTVDSGRCGSRKASPTNTSVAATGM